MEDFIFNNLEAYGPLAVFGLLMLTGIGVPLGEDLIVIPAGMFVAAGKMSFGSVLAATWAGVDPGPSASSPEPSPVDSATPSST